MKILGKGWQYTVYELNKDRVLKKSNSKLQGYLVMLKACFPYTRNYLWQFPYFHRTMKIEAESSLKKILTSKLDQKYFGNPTVLSNGIDYEQDNVESLENYFKRTDNVLSKKVIDNFVIFNQLLINNQLIDKSFAICKNFGINKSGDIVLIDIGEIYSSKESIQKQIDKKAWLADYVLDPLPEELKEYFCTEMEKLHL